MENHPYDLSGGEQQRATLAKVLLCRPDILLLDEPTKGFDAHFKIKLANMLKSLQKNEVTIIPINIHRSDTKKEKKLTLQNIVMGVLFTVLFLQMSIFIQLKLTVHKYSVLYF